MNRSMSFEGARYGEWSPGWADTETSCPFQEGGTADIRRFREQLNARGLLGELKRLEERSATSTLTHAWVQWAVIMIAWFSCVRISWWLAPIALLIMGNRQRALGNLLHDGGHFSLHGTSQWNELWLNAMLSPAMFAVTRVYRQLHRDHHRHLGSPLRDPDLVHRGSHRRMSWLRVLATNVLDGRTFVGSLLGHLPRASPGEFAHIVGWWTVFLGVLGLLFGAGNALAFAGLWLMARATVFHVITTLREISDHAGLSPGGLVQFTRTCPHKGLLRHFFHPLNNGYHLLHHLDPRLPFHALPAAHRLCMQLPEYQRTHHCDGYFFGTHPLVDCWLGRCSGAGES